MPQLLFGMVKLLAVLPVIIGPPNGPFGLRVSATRQGATGTNLSPVTATVVKLAVTLLGLFMTTEIGFVEPVAAPLQLLNAKPKLENADS